MEGLFWGMLRGASCYPQLRRGGELFYPYAFLLLILFSEESCCVLLINFIVRAEGALGIIVSAAADHLYDIPMGIFDCVLD